MFKRYISPSTPHPIRWPVVWGQGPHQGLACKNSVNICWMSWRRQAWEGSNSLVSLLVNTCTSCLLLHKILPQNSVAENSRQLSPNCCCSEIQEQNTWVSWKAVVKILVKAPAISRPSWGKVCFYSVRWFASAPGEMCPRSLTWPLADLTSLQVSLFARLPRDMAAGFPQSEAIQERMTENTCDGIQSFFIT